MRKLNINKVMDATTELIINMPWAGACYATSAIHYIVLDQFNIESSPKLGVVDINGKKFDHGWVEIDNCIYDTAIILGEQSSFHEVFGSDGARGNISALDCKYNGYNINYRVDMSVDDEIIHELRSFGKFMLNRPYFNQNIDYWDLTILIGNHVGLNLERNALISKYSNVTWELTV
ncbi:hypothetical protein ABE427_01970 [Acinetobacter higginsii]|uniref:hypothetical protein n=1 Tax=Acinetobacter higginsii TaxID=70347 RepID=UPI003208B500